MRDQLTIINAFVHDVATGTWIAALAVLTMLQREGAKPAWSASAPLLKALAARFMLLTWTALAVILLTGVVRMVTFKVFGWTGDVARDRIRLLKVKHAVLGVAFLVGTAWQASIAYR